MEWALVLYSGQEGPALWHQRLRLGGLEGSWGTELVLTPDLDVYAEVLGRPSPDIIGVHLSEAMWPPPPGVPRARVYRFAGRPAEAELAAARGEARREAARLFVEAGGNLAALPPERGALLP